MLEADCTQLCGSDSSLNHPENGSMTSTHQCPSQGGFVHSVLGQGKGSRLTGLTHVYGNRSLKPWGHWPKVPGRAGGARMVGRAGPLARLHTMAAGRGGRHPTAWRRVLGSEGRSSEMPLSLAKRGPGWGV